MSMAQFLRGVKRIKQNPTDRFLRNDAGDNAVALTKLDRVPCPEPSFQATGVAKLA